MILDFEEAIWCATVVDPLNKNGMTLSKLFKTAL